MLYSRLPGVDPSRTKPVERFAQGVILLAGLRCSYAARYLPVGSDGLAYLDVARAYLQGHWSTAVNSYWGPLYSWLLAGLLGMVQPSPAHEFAVMQAANFLSLVFCLYAFSRFWRCVGYSDGGDEADNSCLAKAYPVVWVLLGYTLFLFNVIWFVNESTPDLLVSGMVLLIAERVFTLLRREPTQIIQYIGLGLLFALGFYTKAILFYFVAFVFVALAFRKFRSRDYRGPIVAGVVCVFLISPYVLSLSRILGHFTIGETGRLNYAWFVDGTETGPWADGGASFPFFPGPAVAAAPRVFKIPQLDAVTYAPWYDAGRFDHRSRAVLDFRRQVRQLSINLQDLRNEFLVVHSPILVLLIFLICAAPKAFFQRFTSTWPIVVPVVLIIFMYLLVHLVERFMIGFLLVLWGTAYSCIAVPLSYKIFARRALVAAITLFAMSTFPGVLHYLSIPTRNLIETDLLVARALQSDGLPPGHPIALIGNGQTAYWAHWAHLSIAGEVAAMDAPEFWSSPSETQQAVVRKMQDLGADAVVWRRDSDQICPHGWVDLPEHSGCLALIRETNTRESSSSYRAQSH